MLARRLLIAGTGGGSFAGPLLLPDFEVTAPPAGGWTQVQLDRAVHIGSHTFFTYHDGGSGNNEVRRIPDGSTSSDQTFVLHAALAGIEGSPDSHNVGCLVETADGHLLAIYSGHAMAAIYTRKTTNALPDISAWGAEVNIDGSLGKSLYSYPSAFLMDDGDIHLFFRDTQGTPGGPSETNVMCKAVSTDDGATWGAASEIVKRANFQPYWILDSDGSRIDVHLVDGYPVPGTSESPVKGWHMYWDGAWRGTGGTAVAGSAPYAPSALTAVYGAGDGDSSGPWDVNTNGGDPRILQLVNTGSGLRYDYSSWNGSTWDRQPILTIAGEASSRGIVFDHLDVNVVYLTKVVSSVWGVYRYETTDDGATWSSVLLSDGGGVEVDAPCRVRDHGLIKALWNEGTGTSYLDYSVGVHGTTT